MAYKRHTDSKLSAQVGDRIRQARINLQYTQQEVADNVGISVGSYSKFELGNTCQTITTLKAVCEFLHISSDWVLGLNYDIWKDYALLKKEED